MSSYIENLRRHHKLVEEEKYIVLGDALIYTNEEKHQYLAGKLYQQPCGKYSLISDEFEICCQMDNLRLMENEFEEFWFKMLGHGWYFKKEEEIYVGRYVK